MDKPWYRNLFSHPPSTELADTLKKANHGDAEAQFSLGLKFSTDEGDKQNLAEAAHWYRKAAEQQHALAQFNLAIMLFTGQGVPKNDDEAMAWTTRAAEAGDAGAQYMMGKRAHRVSIGNSGPDLTEARIEAYKWFHLAASQGYRDSQAYCHRITESMSWEEASEANHRAARHSASHGPPAS